jgi:hypothetical protein
MRERNLNRQDTILGGMILGGLVVVAIMLLWLRWFRGAPSGLLTCQRRLLVHPLMRGLRLRQRHIPQTSN